MDAEKRSRVKKLLAALPGGSSNIEHLGTSEAEALNERIMSHCCYRDRLIVSFIDALREPQLMFADADGWQKLVDFIPENERERMVYLVADLHGYFRLPASRVPAVLDSQLWTHEVYIVGSDIDWLVGIKHENVFLQGKATALAPGKL
jgi:hypothetical protein